MTQNIYTQAYQSQSTQLAASWSELGNVNIWDMTSLLESVEESDNTLKDFAPVFSFAHTAEGFALDWSPTMPG